MAGCGRTTHAGGIACTHRAEFFVEDQEAYELTPEGWRAAPSFRAEEVRYGSRGPAALAVLCSELRPERLRRLVTPSGVRTVARRRAQPFRHRRKSRRKDG